MDRKFVIALSSLAGSMMLTEAHAIGLGEIKLRTNLNEPLKADIQLLQVKDLSENEILVNLASKDDFAKAGVDRDFLLTSLRFRLDLADPKNPRVVVTTEQPIREPYLNFLVEVQWPSGRLLREYTLLMDLPAFADTMGGSARSLRGTSVPAGEPMPADEGVSEVGSEKPVVKPAPRKPAPAESVAVSDESAAPAIAEPALQPAAGVTVRRATRAEIENYRAAAPVAESVTAEKSVEPESQPETVSAATADSPAADIAPATPADGSYGPTQSSDTLWKIAQRVRPAGGVSVHQTMVAIQRLNPQAFSNGNINLLKKGQVLKLPSQEEISSITQGEAVSAVDSQVAEWKAKRGQTAAPVGGQLDATGKAAEEAPAAVASEGQLKLAAPAEVSESKAGAGAGEAANSKAEIKALKNQLTVGMEELNRAQRENQDLASRAKDLDGQIANAEKLLNLQSGELAALQAKLVAEQQARQEEQARLEAEAKAKAEAAAAAQLQQTTPATEPAGTAVPAQGSAAESVAPALPSASTEAAQPPTTEAAATDMAPQPAKPVEPAPQVQESAAKPAPAETPASQPVVAEKSDSPLSSKPVIGGIVGVLALLLALFGYRRMAEKRAQSDDEEDSFAGFGEETVEPEHHVDTSVAAEVDEDLLNLDEEIEAAQQVEAAAEVEAAPAPKPETGDVLGEADIYISFGNFDKGETLLRTAINGEPQRTDYRLKLLELYKEADNLAAFDEVYKELIELDDDAANLRAGELRGRISGADSTPFAFGVSSAAAAAGISDDELDLDFDLEAEPVAESAPLATAAEDFDIDFTSEVAAPAADQKPAETFDLDMDLDLDFDLPSSAPASEALTAKHPAIDLGNMNLEVPVAEIEPAAEAEVEAESSVSVDDLGLDFDLDLDLDSGADVGAEPEAVQLEDATPVAADVDNSMLEAVTADAGEVDEELDFLSDADEAATKLDLARAYIDMGDKDGARDILEEVLEEGREDQKREARTLLDDLA